MNHDANFYSVLQGIANATSHQPAISAPGKQALNYGALVQQINYCAAGLTAMGMQRDSRIAVVIPNGPDMATCCLGVMATAVCAPLNPAYQASEFRFYLEDLGADALLLPAALDSPAREVASELGISVIDLAVGESEIAGQFSFSSNAALRTSADPAPQADDIALILHTSGTTSKPKIVPLTHRNLAASAANIRRTLQLGEADVCLNMMPLFHIHGLVAALLSSISAGASIVCTGGYDCNNFGAWLQRFSPTWYSAVPTIHQAILRLYETADAPADYRGFRFLRSSSAALSPTLLKALVARFHVPVIEAYGMTEAAHQMSSNPLPPGICKPGSVGLPAGPDICIMDETGTQLAAGATGEIVIRGDNVTAGYEDNPEANRTAFTAGWFRTGDQGFVDADGYLTITGRLKEIINRGGEKISPREIDEALLQRPEVLQAVAFAVPHPSLGEDVFAAVVLEPGSAVRPEDLRAHLFAVLADYKVPSKIILLDDIPKGATGKVQRLSLAGLLQSHLHSGFEAPRTDNEALVCRAIAEVLGLKQVGRHDNFFALGGDSIRAAQVIARLNSSLSIQLLVPKLFLHPTPAELAGELEAALAEKEGQLDALMKEFEHLSEEEILQLLAENQPGKA